MEKLYGEFVRCIIILLITHSSTSKPDDVTILTVLDVVVVCSESSKSQNLKRIE